MKIIIYCLTGKKFSNPMEDITQLQPNEADNCPDYLLYSPQPTFRTRKVPLFNFLKGFIKNTSVIF